MKLNLRGLSGRGKAPLAIVFSIIIGSCSCHSGKSYLTTGFVKANMKMAGICEDLVYNYMLFNTQPAVVPFKVAIIHPSHKLLSVIDEKTLKIRTEVCSTGDSVKPGNNVYRKPVLEGEIKGINTWYIELNKNVSYPVKPRENSASAYLVTHGTATLTQGSRKFKVNGLNLFVPSVKDEALILADKDGFGMLEIKIKLTEAEYQLLKQEHEKLPYFVDYTQCRTYKEAIKSEKTVSRMILPENIIPRFCMGSVETSGPDKVGAHAHAMLEQLFFGLKMNDCIVNADGIKQPFRENILLHIPLGSMHEVLVEDGKVLNYIWMDLFRSQEDMGYIKENHIMQDK
jgi:hypothetical protein